MDSRLVPLWMGAGPKASWFSRVLIDIAGMTVYKLVSRSVRYNCTY
jgi:hypothetical protein